MDLNLVGISVDDQGMVVDELDEVMKNWAERYPSKPLPR